MSRKNKILRAFLHQNQSPTIEQAWDAAWKHAQKTFHARSMQGMEKQFADLQAECEKLRKDAERLKAGVAELAAPAAQGELEETIGAVISLVKDAAAAHLNSEFNSCLSKIRKLLTTAMQPAPDVDALVEAAEAALEEIESIMHEAYNSAYPVCCGRAGSECCGSPDPEWDEADQRMMDRLDPHQKSLRAALAARRKQGGGVSLEAIEFSEVGE